ncbi:MAG: ribosome recycling factor [Planctomycetota bacterium]|jgi:ribosome recycling factor
MSYDFKQTKQELAEISVWLEKEFSQISTGRATPALLDSVMVSHFGAMQPIKSLSSIHIEDPRTLRIAPWDSGSIKSIENAIIDSGLPVSVSSDDKGVRVNIPQQTEEGKLKLLKLLKAKLEDARVSVRARRQETEKAIEALEKDGDFSEDDKFRYKDELQKLVDATNRSLEEMYKNKESKIMTV